MPLRFWLTLLLFSTQKFMLGQEVIRLQNPSFEFDTYNQAGKVPMFWENFGSEKESPPDLQPGYFGCQITPFDGHTSVGLVTRDNGTVEAIGQKLEKSMIVGQKYRLSVALMRSPIYVSQSRKTGQVLNFNTPVALLIYGIGHEITDQAVVLAKSEAIVNEFWEVHHFDLQSTNFDCRYLVFRAVFPNEGTFCNGNLMIDGISDLVPVNPIALENAVSDPVDCEKQAISIPNPSFEELSMGETKYSNWEFLVMYDKIPEHCIEKGKAAEGERFLVLTTAANEHFAKVFTEIERPMCPGVTYQLSLKARHCPPKRKPFKFAGMTMEIADHKGCFLRVLGVDGTTGRKELLATIGPVTNAEWETFVLFLTPKTANTRAIILQAWNDESRTGMRTRSIFIDDLSQLLPKN